MESVQLRDAKESSATAQQHLLQQQQTAIRNNERQLNWFVKVEV